MRDLSVRAILTITFTILLDIGYLAWYRSNLSYKKGLLTPAKRAIAAPPGESEYNSGSGQSDVFSIPLSYSAPPLPMLPLEFQGVVPRQETRVMGLHCGEDCVILS